MAALGLVAAACSGDGDGGGGALDPVQPGTRSTATGCELEPPRNAAATPELGPSPFNGLGTWIDVFDYVPEYAADGTPTVVAEHVALLAELGVRTIYLQSARNDSSGDAGVVAPGLVDGFVDAAHDRGLCVVGWYLPRLESVAADLTRLVALRDHETVGGGRFDGVAVDIEWTAGVVSPSERSQRLVELSVQARAALGDLALAAIVPPPVQMEVVNPAFWPGFPWARLVGSYDVWMPMTYWTFRTVESGYRDPYRYVSESVARLRVGVGDAAAPVHPIGGIGDAATAADYRAFLRAADDAGAVGVSVYDFGTTTTSAWRLLAAPAAPTGG